MTRGHVHGSPPAQSDRPYLIRAYESQPGVWTGEACDGAGVAITARGQYSREDALSAAERGLATAIREGGRLPGKTARPDGEVRVVARNGRGVEAAAWVPESSTRLERIDRFDPSFELYSESLAGGFLLAECNAECLAAPEEQTRSTGHTSRCPRGLQMRQAEAPARKFCGKCSFDHKPGRPCGKLIGPLDE